MKIQKLEAVISKGIINAKPDNAWSLKIKKDFKVNKSLYLLMLLVMAYFVIFKYMPMYGTLIAIKDYSPKLGVFGSPYVGLKHFIDFFSSPSFGTVLKNTLIINFWMLLAGFPAPIILALLINEVHSSKFARLIQNFTYLPHFIALVIICGLVKDFTMNTGIVGQFVGNITGVEKSLLLYPKYFIPIYVISGMWQEVGWGSIIYLAALTAIDGSLYEAAEIDGAGRWKQTLHITLPGIVPVIITMLILRMGNILNVGFEKIILLYNDSIMNVADVISSYAYRRGLIDLDWSFSAAVGLFNSAVNLFFLVMVNCISKKANSGSIW